jgi:hypothetical protein
MTDELHRDVGRLEGEMGALKDLISEVRSDVKDIKSSFDQMQGGTKTLIAFSAVIGAALSQAVHWFWNAK